MDNLLKNRHKNSVLHKGRVVNKNLPALLAAFLLLCLSGTGFAAFAVKSAESTNAHRPQWVPNEIIVKFRNGVSKNHIDLVNRRHGTHVLSTSPFAGFKRIKVPATGTPKQLVEIYNREPEIEYAELNYYAYTMFVPNDPIYSFQWHLNDPFAGINIEAAWDITTGDPNVIVAVIDTGVAYETYGGRFELAPDLANTNFVAGYNFVKGNEHANDDDGHGTHVTGTIAQSTNNGLGVAGIAFDCSIMPIKVLASRGPVSSGSHADIADGIYFAADNGAHVINMSLGGPSGSNTLRDAIEYAYNQGVTIICSAGNDGPGAPKSFPAAYDDYCIAVAATRYDKARAPYSTTGSFVDIVAPGGDTNVDQNQDTYADGILQQTFGLNPKDWGYWFYQGTSMAAPHVSGIAALLISTGVTHPDDVREALEATAQDLGAPGKDVEYGWGFIDAYAALNYFHISCDFNSDGVVDFKDLRTLLNSWLMDDPSVDIAPPGGDGIINFLDFAQCSESWNQ
ncbi:MAG: S8 family serine peptidase [Phycisphaerae bacterium]|nr:peptidase S8 [Candidatus Saccharibacteria bacterium]NIS50872.1 peptidase S8 [Phycisphaerae bacterium]NIU09638.1 peptidase S8 [Phycisphaerae bacterium]NIU57291.1 S8 family serine peptidase [Phycisphaerae bacterium]NIW92669.1 S8 family serine peptidase [Phycisphaerae bacterium]